MITGAIPPEGYFYTSKFGRIKISSSSWSLNARSRHFVKILFCNKKTPMINMGAPY